MDPVHLPKYERLGALTFLIVRIYDSQAPMKADSVQSLTRKVAIFSTPDFIITLHRLDPDWMEQQLVQRCLREQIEADEENPPAVGAPSQVPNFLLRFLNRCIRTYTTPIERAEDELDSFENAVMESEPSPSMLKALHATRRRLSLMKRILIHTRDVINNLIPGFENLSPLYQDLRENVATLIFLSDELLEDTHASLNLHFNLNSQKTSEVMRILTVFSVFFMPLNFLAGIYGMNFEHMPELHWRWGYPFVIASMIAVSGTIGFWFWRRGWLRTVSADQNISAKKETEDKSNRS